MSIEARNRGKIGKLPVYYFSGSQAEHSASAVQYCRIMQECLLQMSSSVSGGWELYYKNDANDLNVFDTTYNRLFHSRGDRSLTSSATSAFDGDCRLFVLIDWTTTTNVNNIGYRDAYWSTGVGVDAGTTNSIGIGNATSSFDWWCFGNEYEVRFITARPSATASNVTWLSWGFGLPYPTHLPDDHRGTAFSTGSTILSGTNVSITLDRPMDRAENPQGSFKPGYPIHIWGIIPSGSGETAPPATGDLTRVVSITGSTLVVERIKQNYSMPVMIGYNAHGTWLSTDGTTADLGGTNSVHLNASASTLTLSELYNEKPINVNGVSSIHGPTKQNLHQTSQQTVYAQLATIWDTVGGSRIIRFACHPLPGPTGSTSVLYDEYRDLSYLYLGVGGNGGGNSQWDFPFFNYSGSLSGKIILSGNFDEGWKTHTKTINLNPPSLPATGNWWDVANGYGTYENWRNVMIADNFVFGIDFEVTNCIPCFEDIAARSNLVFEENYANSLMKSNIYQFIVPTASAVPTAGGTCPVPQAPFIYGIPSVRSVLGRQKYRAAATALASSNLPTQAQELTASC